MRWTKDTLYSTLSGSLVFVTGFAALNLFWIFGDWPRDVPGLWDYRSATIGDGLLLPASAMVLVAATLTFSPANRESVVAIGSGFIGLLTGVLLQLAWLHDPNPQLNWTLPKSHTFNAAGWYHAAFLVGASTMFSAWTSRLLWRLRDSRSMNPTQFAAFFQSPHTALLIGCLLGFVGLVVMDSSSTRIADFGTLITIGICTLFLVLLLFWVIGGGTTTRIRAIPWGVALAVGICLFGWQIPIILTESTISHHLVFGGAILVLGLHLWTTGDSYWWISTATGGLLLASGWSLSLASPLFQPYVGALGVAGTIALVAVPTRMVGHDRRGITQLGAGLCIVLIAFVIEAWLRKSAANAVPAESIASGFITFLLTTLAAVGTFRYNVLVNDERKYLKPGHILEASFWTTWLTLILFAFGGMLASFCLAESGHLSGLLGPSAVNGLSFNKAVLLAGALITFIVSGTAVITSTTQDTLAEGADWRCEPIIEPTLRSTVLAICFVIAWSLAPWIATWTLWPSSLGPSRHLLAPLFIVLAIVLATWASHLTMSSIWTNVARFNLYRFGRRAWIVCIACGCAVGSTVLWMLLVGVWVRGEWANVVAIAYALSVTYFGGAVVATMCAWTLWRSAPTSCARPAYLTLHHPAANTLHDHLLHGFSLVATVVALIVVDKLVASYDTSAWGCILLLSLTESVTLMGPAFYYTKTMSQGHIADELLKTERDVREDSRWRITEAWLVRSGGELEEILAMKREQMERVRSRLAREFKVTSALSPFGLLGMLWKSASQFVEEPVESNE